MVATDDWLISDDDHVIEPVHVWASRLSAADRQGGSHLVEIERDVKSWACEVKIIHIRGLWAGAGKKREEFSPKPTSYAEMRTGCYEPNTRVADMNEGGVLACVCFPSFPRFCDQAFLEGKDHDLASRYVHAWNGFILDEWSAAGDRPVPVST